MEYRTLPHGKEKISILGLGTSSIQASTEKEIEDTIRFAVENGVNSFDMASSEAKPFPAYGRALADCRKKVYFQIHFGADYSSGTYGWTTNLETVKRSVDWQMSTLKTDYIDFGFIHCIDESSDLRKVQKSGIIEYILELKEQGVVHQEGLSSHTPALTNQVLDMGIVDMLMFSINPGYDYQRGDYGIGSVAERMNLYRRCEKEGVGISVMKAFSGGQLLSAGTSPFGKPLTEYQCIQYALVKANANEDMALMFFKTLAQLNDLDLRVLGLYSLTSEETAHDIVSELKISYEQLKHIKEKLERFGLLQSKNEEISDDNLEKIVKYLQDVEKERKKSRPRDIKLPRLKKISSSDTYRITSLGREYLQLVKE